MVDETTYRRTLKWERSVIQDGPRRHKSYYAAVSSDEDGSSSDVDVGECLATRKGTHADKHISHNRHSTLSPPAMLIAPNSGELISPDQLESAQRDGDFYQFKAVSAEGKPEEVVLMCCQQEVNGFSLQQKLWSRFSSPPRDSTFSNFYIYVMILRFLGKVAVLPPSTALL